MVLDPFTALGLAGNVVQFVDFGSKLVSEARDIYRSTSGNSTRNAQLLNSAGSFRRLSDHLAESTKAPFPSQDQDDLTQFAESCRKTVDELIRILEGLTVNSPNRKWRSIQQASRAALKRGKIDELATRMDRLRSEMCVRLMTMFRYV